uniref:NAD-dependent epimerase/dehydratase domain-containing protein n=1 Tax=Leersia perrieri TaxID=77586 RepID=A0A0D9UZA8_9ORYZ
MAPGVHSLKPAAPAAAVSPPQQPSPAHMLVLGTGFVGRYVSQRLLTQGWSVTFSLLTVAVGRVSGTCTSPAKKTELEMLGVDASVFDATRSSLANLRSLQDATHLLISIPPIPGIGDPLLSSHSDLQSTLKDSNLQWLCYLSSTSVYGDCDGAWVDEDAVDTIAKRKSLSQRQKLRESKQYTARIHVADIYQAILASMSIRSARRIYNVVDDDPAPRAEVFAFARSLVERRHPSLLKDSAVSGTQDIIVAAEKRVSNARLKEELGTRLLHPTYKSGLESILDSWHTNSTLSTEISDI